jgi:hypothetical protein
MPRPIVGTLSAKRLFPAFSCWWIVAKMSQSRHSKKVGDERLFYEWDYVRHILQDLAERLQAK